MPVFFQSLRSSSAGNVLALWTPTSSILIDCGMRVQRDCKRLLDAHARRTGGIDAVVVTHAHGDHMPYGALRVLGKEQLPVHAPGEVIRQLRGRDATGDWLKPPSMHVFPASGLEVGDFTLAPFEVPHSPGMRTYGFAITASDGRSRRRIVVCTDFYDYDAVAEHFEDADFIFIESNHDRALLRKYPNPNSWYHLDNVRCASLLLNTIRRSISRPRAVMLGHLSEERNRAALATGEVERVFRQNGTRITFRLDAAPACRASGVIEI